MLRVESGDGADVEHVQISVDKHKQPRDRKRYFPGGGEDVSVKKNQRMRGNISPALQTNLHRNITQT